MACRPAGSSTVLSLPIHIYCRCWILCCWLCACTPSSFASVPSGVSVPGLHPPPRVLTFHRALQFEYMDPDEATKLTQVNIDLVAQWAGIEGDRQDNTTVRGSLFSLLGCNGSEPPRTLALLPHDDVQTVLATWRIPRPAPAAATPPSMTQLGQVGVFFRTCRFICGTLPEQQAARLQPIAPAAPPATTGPRKVKMSQVINQVDDEEVDHLDANAINAAYIAYRDQLGGFPPDDEELSAEQLTTLSSLYKSGRAPYTDMAIWGPFQHRIQKKIKLKGLGFTSSGEFAPIELYGPADFESWRECYMEQITPSKLDAYEKTIRQFHDRYGKACWAIIYQADVRARLEQVERIRRRGQEAYESARRLGLSHPFDPNRPWEWVWKELAEDYIFWNKEVVEPSMLYLAKTANLTQLLADDAPIVKASSPASASAAAPTSRPATGDSRPSKRQRGPDVRVHRIGEDGMFTHNRRDMELCKLFQTGECTEKDIHGNCSRNPSRRHQCSKCLSELHGANKCPNDTPKPPRAGHRKGKSKGKSKK